METNLALVVAVDGNEHSLTAPPNTLVADLITEVVEALSLSSENGHGDRVVFTARLRDNDLDPESTLHENGVTSGDYIEISATVTAGVGQPPSGSAPGSVQTNLSDDAVFQLIVSDQEGNDHKIEAPANLVIADFIRTLTDGLGPSSAIDPDIHYVLTSASQGWDLDERRSLEQNGVRPGDHLVLRRVVYAGGRSDEISFSVFAPRRLQSKSTLLAYVYVPAAQTAVNAHAAGRLQDKIADFAQTSAAVTETIKRGATITIVPSVLGCTFEPSIASFKWVEAWHYLEFAITPRHRGPAAATHGNVLFFVGPVLIGSVDVTMTVGTAPEDRRIVSRLNRLFRRRDDSEVAAYRALLGRSYKNVFVSYAHTDVRVIDALEQAYTSLGLKYLRDVRDLRSGDNWNVRLLELIDQADVFQLCWSTRASTSVHVRAEWRHALGVPIENFIRPVYWEDAMPPVPPELRHLHFARLDVAVLTGAAAGRDMPNRVL